MGQVPYTNVLEDNVCFLEPRFLGFLKKDPFLSLFLTTVHSAYKQK